MEAGTDAAIAFLEQLYPEGLWSLTSIQPDKKGIETRTFSAQSADATRAWIEKFNGKRNIYFSVNQPSGILRKKAEKSDIRAAHYLHVDIDPRAGEDLAEEQERIRQLVVEENGWPDHLPRPQIVLFSGGGYQCFFRLAEPVAINGDIDKAEEFERYNKALELALDGDNCHNCDRIMRLPGTLNIPDAKKIKKGRVPVEAAVLLAREGAIPLQAITPAPRLQSAEAAAPRGHIQRGAVVARLDELDSWGVPDPIKVIIAQGALPDREDMTEKQRHFSRSEWLFYACCEMVRHEVPDETILSLITDPNWGISAHVLAQKNVERYAVRQIERAHDRAIDPMLLQLNERYAVVKNIGGKCRVIEEVADEALKRTRLTTITFADFKAAWCNRLVQVGTKDDTPVYAQAGKWWLENPRRTEHDRIVFFPEGNVPPGVRNLWTGFAVEPRPGTCERFLAHVRGIICAGNEEHYRYLLGWMARTVQEPARAGETAIVLRGGQGTGKTLFVDLFGRLFGRHYLDVADIKHITGNFNAHLQDCLLLFGDEAFQPRDSNHEGRLKTLITSRTLDIERKGIDLEVAANYVHLVLASNNDWVVPAAMDDRRFLVLDVSPARVGDYAYFKALVAEMDDGGTEALLHLLRTHDLRDFNVRAVPKTAGLRDQQVRSLAPIERTFLEILDHGASPDEQQWTSEFGPDFVSAEALCERLPAWVRNNEHGIRTRCGQFLARQAVLDAKTDKPMVQKIDRVVPVYPGSPEKRRVQLKFYQLRPRPELCVEWGEFYEFADPEAEWGAVEQAPAAPKVPF